MSGTVDVVVATCRATELVAECVARLVADPAVGRVIVVDDGPDRTAAAPLPGATVIALPGHRGLSHAFNRGTAATGAELVLFLNDDVLPAPGSVATLAAALGGERQAVAAGGRLLELGSDRTQRSYQPRQLPGLPALLVRVTGIERRWPRNPCTGAHLTRPLPEDGVHRTDRQPAGACLLVRREALAAVGGWDERFWVWYEDVDLIRRLLALGPLLYVPGAMFEHAGGASTGSMPKHEQRARLHHGTLLYGQVHLGPLARRTLAAAVGALSALRWALAGSRPAERAAYRRLTATSLRALRGEPLPEPPR